VLLEDLGRLRIDLVPMVEVRAFFAKGETKRTD